MDQKKYDPIYSQDLEHHLEDKDVEHERVKDTHDTVVAHAWVRLYRYEDGGEADCYKYRVAEAVGG